MIASRLKTEYLVNPMGIDIQHPRLQWTCEGGVKQTAYRIVTEKWDSGKAVGDSMCAYYPQELASGERVNWKIRLWDENDEPGEWSEAFFEMGLLSPSDCPTRERMGWTGDSQVFFGTASYLADYAAFARKHLRDVFDRQWKNGKLPQIAPYANEDWFMNVMNGSVGWADVGILMPYRFYKKYGDRQILKDSFENMLRYAEFMISRCGKWGGIYAKPLGISKENRKYAVNAGQSYGEWAEPNDVKAFVWTDFAEPHPEESTAYTAWVLGVMVEICDILGPDPGAGQLRLASRHRLPVHADDPLCFSGHGYRIRLPPAGKRGDPRLAVHAQERGHDHLGSLGGAKRRCGHCQPEPLFQGRCLRMAV